MSNEDDENGNGSGAPLARIGEYQVIVLDDNGKEAQKLFLQTKTAFPAVGTAIDFLNDDGSRTPYRVVDVRHPEEETEQFSQWRFTGYVAIVRKDDRPGPSTDPGERPRKSDPAPRQPPTASASNRGQGVLSFHHPQPEARSRLLNFWRLIGWTVWEGYREQTQYFENWKFAVWQLHGEGNQWLVRQIAGGLPASHFRELSRAAKRSAGEALTFLEQLRAIQASAEDQLADVIPLDQYREAKS